MASKTIQQAFAELQALVANTANGNKRLSPLAYQGIAAYLATGKTAGIDMDALAHINAALVGTPFQGQPTNAWYAVPHAKSTSPVEGNVPEAPTAGNTPGVTDNNSPGYPGTAPSVPPPAAPPAPPAAAPSTSLGGVTDNNSPGYPGNAPSGGGIAGTPGGFDAGQNEVLRGAAQSGQADSPAMRAILRQMGISDPSHMGPMGEFIAQKFAPLFASWLSAQQYAPGGSGDGSVTDNMQGLMAQFAKLLSTPGANAFGQLQQTAQSALTNPALQGLMGDITSPDQQKVLNQLLGLKYSGAGDLLANAMGNRAQNAYSDYQDANIGISPNGGGQPAYTGRFYDWLNNGNQGKPDPRASLFGIGK